MQAFKFRSSQQFAYALEIIFERRLHCAGWDALNDPMEGWFEYTWHADGEGADAVVERILKTRSQLRICSLSATFESHLLWAHYASGFDGLAIEVDLPSIPEVRPIVYRDQLLDVDTKSVQDLDEVALQTLSWKHRAWNYEQEIRIISKNHAFQLPGPITKVIAGPRMNKALRDTLKLVCEAKNIPLWEAVIGNGKIRIEEVEKKSA